MGRRSQMGAGLFGTGKIVRDQGRQRRMPRSRPQFRIRSKRNSRRQDREIYGWVRRTGYGDGSLGRRGGIHFARMYPLP